MTKKINIAIIGASGYTGAELIRLLINHPNVRIAALSAGTNAGSEMVNLYPHLSHLNLPALSKIEEINFQDIDLAFCCLPHTTSQETIKNLLLSPAGAHLKIIDLSADFRLGEPENYQKWYGHEHLAPKLQKQAVYGLSELARPLIKKSNLIANPGCYPTSALLPLLPLLHNNLIHSDNIIIDSKSGVSGAGRALKLSSLFCEVNDTVKAYAVGTHRHIGEIEQELSKATGKQDLHINFTPHLIPMSRGIISTIYVRLKEQFTISNLKDCLETKYEAEPFIQITTDAPSTREVLGTNFCKIAVFPARIKGQAVIISVIDNLVKGASGQAVQNMNIIYGFDEKEGLRLPALMP